MSEKTEEPTPKKLRDARKKGNVAMSKDANNALTYLLAIALLYLGLRGLGAAFSRLFHQAVDFGSRENLASDVLAGAAVGAIQDTLRALAPVIFPLAAFGVLVAFAQVGPLLSAESMKPKLSKLNPLAQLKNIFSVKGLFEFAKTVLKLGVVMLLGWLVIKGSLADILMLGLVPAEAILPEAARIARHFLWVVGIVFVGLAGLDFGFQRWQWKKGLKMTKDEVKREYKEQEGDPEIKAERRSIHQELINQDVPRAMATADAVVVNPTHFAIAIEYKKDRMAAPKVTAKGQTLLARRIVRLAKKHDVPIVRDIKLARALYRVRIDDYVPKELYETVAEVLMFAWKVRREAGGDRFGTGG